MIIPRYSIVSSVTKIEEEFTAEFQFQNNEKWFNAYPGAELPVIIDKNNIHTVVKMEWGLTPFWSRFRMNYPSHFLANSFDLLKDRWYRVPIRRNRCIVPANCFFISIKDQNGNKQPYLVYIKKHRIFSMAGIWDHWIDQRQEPHIHYQSFAVIFSPAPKRLRSFVPYTPAIVHPSARRKYLMPGTYMKDIMRTLQPFDTDLYNLYPISKKIYDRNLNQKEILLPISSRVFDEYTYKKSYHLKLEGMGGKHHDFYGQNNMIKLDT